MVTGANLLPAISIVMPLYNKKADVLASIASVQAQTLTNWELIIIDDGSTDGGPDMVLALNEPRINLHRQSNAGVSAARNCGIELANSGLIAFLDADDLWLPDFLTSIYSLVSDFPEAQWFATGYEKHDVDGNVTSVRLHGLVDGFTRGILAPYFVIAMQSEPPVWTSATAVRRSAINAVGGFPVGIKSGEDLLTWARLAVRFPLAYDVGCKSVFRISGVQRPPDPQQRVMQELSKLLAANPETPGLRAYLGLWCRMQAVMAIRFHDSRLARRYACKAVLANWRDTRNLYTLCLCIFPARFANAFDDWLRQLISR